MAEDGATNSVEEKENSDGIKILLDSTYPLLQRFREACPGTYKHSQNLASMVEGIALSLDLDVTKLKVAAQYHDVGKMCNPKYFTENQLEDENPHDKLSPIVSYNIITRHVSDSVMYLVNDSNFPRDIIEIISQHHGQSVLRYFFDKSGSDVEDAFRYKTPKPTCVDSAVLMICDHIEATSRALVQSGKFDSSNVIETTISNLIDDGQLDDVYMRLGDLKRIKEALAKELEGTYQKRVDYDKAKEEKVKEEKD
jgi:hypothetical protein